MQMIRHWKWKPTPFTRLTIQSMKVMWTMKPMCVSITKNTGRPLVVSDLPLVAQSLDHPRDDLGPHVLPTLLRAGQATVILHWSPEIQKSLGVASAGSCRPRETLREPPQRGLRWPAERTALALPSASAELLDAKSPPGDARSPLLSAPA